MSFENICSVQYEACLTISHKNNKKANVDASLGESLQVKVKAAVGAPGRARSFMGSQKCKQDGYPLGRFVGQHKPQNVPKEVFPCFKITFMAWKSFLKNLHFKKVYKLFWHQRKGKREEEMDANGQFLWEERVFFSMSPLPGSVGVLLWLKQKKIIPL